MKGSCCDGSVSITELPVPSGGEARRATPLRGLALLRDPALNKGTAFSAAERRELGLEGWLPQQVESLDLQVQRAWELDHEIDTAASSAKLENGVLTLSLARLEPQSKATTLSIQ